MNLPFASAALGLAFAVSAPASAQSGFCHLPPWTAPGAPQPGFLGAAVALDGQTALLGDTSREIVVVLTRLGTQWYPLHTFSDPDGAGTAFGETLAVDGDRFYVGAPSADAGGSALGSVHVYERGPSGWAHTQRVTSTTPTEDGRFGAALSAHNDWLAVGAPRDNGTGRAQVWSFESGAPTYVNSVGNFATSGEFGRSLALHRPEGSAAAFLFVGDPFDDTVANNGGAVRYFRVHPMEIAFGAVLAPLELDPGDVFGVSVAFDGAHLVVGASGDDDVAPSAGAAYVYDVPPPGPLVANFAGKLLGPDTDSGDYFGRTVAVDGQRIAVGAPLQGQPGPTGGKVHLYRPAIFGSGWLHDGRLEPDPATPAKNLSYSLALHDELVLVGAPQTATGPTLNGAAFLFSTAGGSLPGGLCPAPVLATAIPYGPSKSGPGGTPTLGFNSLPVPGQFTQLVAKGLVPGTTPILLIGAAPDLLPFDGGHFLVANPILLPMPTVTAIGQVGMGWNVPAATGLVGVEMFAQVFGFDPGAVGSFATVHSRGLGLSVGY